MSKCKECKGITKEQVMIGYYLCKFNSSETVEYMVKPEATACANCKPTNKKQETQDE